MTDPEARPFAQTEWEADQNESAGMVTTDLLELSRQIQEESAAVATLTREAIVADNKKFRRRNSVLVGLCCVMIVALGFLVYRDVYINSPERARIVAQTNDLINANEKLDEINAFIEEVEDSNNESGASDEQLQAVFEAVFDTREILTCVLTAPDDAAVRACAALGQES